MSNTRELFLSLVVVVLVLIFCIKQVSGIVVDCKNNFVTKREKQTTVATLKTNVESIEAAHDKIEKQQSVLKPFYKQQFVQNDSIAAFGGMFEDMVDYIKIDGLLLRSIEYNVKPDQDLIYKNFSTSYIVCEIKMFLIGTYPQLKAFLKDIDLYPYYISVSQMNVVPYESNKKYLLVNISVNLYSRKQ